RIAEAWLRKHREASGAASTRAGVRGCFEHRQSIAEAACPAPAPARPGSRRQEAFSRCSQWMSAQAADVWRERSLNCMLTAVGADQPTSAICGRCVIQVRAAEELEVT